MPELLDEVSSQGGGRSSLYRFLYRNHDELIPWLRYPRWVIWADRLGKRGLRMAKGEKPTANGMRKTWQRVRADIARERGVPMVASNTASGKAQALPKIFLDPEKLSPMGLDHEPEAEEEFGFATPRGWKPPK